MLGFGERTRTDLKSLLLLWVVGQRSVGSVARMVTARPVVGLVVERLELPPHWLLVLLADQGSSFAARQSVRVVPRNLQKTQVAGKERRRFGLGLTLRLQPEGLRLRLRVEESFLDVG